MFYYIPNQDGKVALKSWLDSYIQSNPFSSYLPLILMIGPGIVLLVWGTSIINKEKKYS